MSEEEFERSLKSHYKVTSSFLSGLALMLLDFFMTMLSLGIGFFIINLINDSWINFRSFVTYYIYMPFILVVFYAAGLYPGILTAPEDEVKRFSLCTFFSFIGIAFSVTIQDEPERWAIAAALTVSWPFATVLLPGGRELGRRIFTHLKGWGVPAVVYSHGHRANVIVDRLLTRPYYGYTPVLIITDANDGTLEYHGVPVRTYTEELFALIKKLNIKVAIICDYTEHLEELQTYYRYVIRVPKSQIATNMSLRMRNFGGILGFSSTNYLTRQSALALKRFIDIFIIVVFSPLLIPLTLCIALCIKLTSPGPIFYGHKRVGKNRKEIRCWKFRSMAIDADKQLEQILANDPVRAAEWEKERKFTDDPRVTPFGKILRKTSLDEIPQMWNILLGQMSFVGPRPVTEAELAKYGAYADYVLSVKPGLSGMWQISGRSDTGYEERITLDTYYIQNWSIWLDIWILIKTVWVVLRRKGAY